MNILFIGNSLSKDEFKNAIDESDNFCFLSNQKQDLLDQWSNVIDSFDWVVIDRRNESGGKDTDQSPVICSDIEEKVQHDIKNGPMLMFKDIEQGIILSYSAPVKRRA